MPWRNFVQLKLLVQSYEQSEIAALPKLESEILSQPETLVLLKLLFPLLALREISVQFKLYLKQRPKVCVPLVNTVLPKCRHLFHALVELLSSTTSLLNSLSCWNICPPQAKAVATADSEPVKT